MPVAHQRSEGEDGWRAWGKAGDDTRRRESWPNRRKHASGLRRRKKRPEVENRLAGKGENIKKKLDSVLDEIDDVLEENAEEFVAGYIQHGGQ